MSKYLDRVRAENDRKAKLLKKTPKKGQICNNSLIKKTVSQLDKLIWKECRRIAAIRWPDPVSCYVCGRKSLIGANKQLAHLIPKGSCGAFLKFDFRNLRFCCYHCNINLGGNGAEYLRKMEKEVGKEKLEELFNDKNKIINAKEHYVDLLLKYRQM